ncbi:MAG: DUF5916 domain-containing protein [Candidatus Aminicenantes bacterium]|nr:DUF5916 domain-containing protein [Candidatus Aminicenantes bacterium]
MTERISRRSPARTPLAVIFVLTMLGLPHLQAAPPKAPEKMRLEIPRLSAAPRIDGFIEPGIWEKEALRLDNFVQLSPKAGEPTTMKTIAYVGFDAKAVYFAFRCIDPEPKKLRASITRRDGCLDDDWIIVFLDTFNEKRRAATFGVNPVGVQMDFVRIEEGGNDNMDDSWDTDWNSEGRIDDQGYTVELAIPFKSLRFPDQDEKVWGLTLARNIPRIGEIGMWPSFSRDIPGLIAQSNPIVIRGSVERGNNLELMPVATALKREGSGIDFQPGLNLKYGLKSDLTLDATINPDFSHIEADAPQIDINLRYALRYQEKRPFFLEGMEIFNFPDIEMVYTRRITDPLWGAKVTGKLGGMTYGVLSAYDQHPTESLWDVHNGGGSGDETALFNIVRVKTDIFNKGSYLGFCLADKEIDGSWNRVAGVDGQWRFADKFFVSFQALASKTSWDGDTTDLAPALYGEAYYFNKNYSFGGFWRSIHPDFEASSGFVNRTDYRSAGAFANLRLYPDKPYLNQVQLHLEAGQRDGYFDSITQDTWLRAQTQLRFTEFNQLIMSVENGLERYAETDFHRTVFQLQGQSNIVKWLPFNLFAEIGDTINYDPEDAYLGWGVTYGVGLNFKPSKRLQLGLDYSRSTFWKTKAGEQVWDFNVFHTRSTYQLTKSLSLRAIFDYNLYYKQIFGSFLVSYVLRPGTVFFVGYDSNYERGLLAPTRYDRRDYSVFVKFSYWWRI